MGMLRGSWLGSVLLVSGLCACARNEGNPGATAVSPATAAAPSSVASAPSPPSRRACIAAAAPDAPRPVAKHHPGADCLSSGCHDGSVATAPRWSVAGTLFNDAAGTAPVAGATIELVADGGEELRLLTAADGSFYTAAPVRFPLRVRASQCPTDEAMFSKVSALPFVVS